MAIDRLPLRKLLKILFLEQRELTSALRSDIREQIARDEGQNSSGGDFYAPFWSDVRAHVLETGDLSELVEARIERNERRRNLYTQLHDGFLQWWDNRRRWTNAPFVQGELMRARFPFPGLDAVVKVDSVLTVTDATGTERAIYPYFFPDPQLSDQAARWGLWLISSAFPEVRPEEFRILDVIRGRTFSLDRYPLNGREEEEFRERYSEILRQHDVLRQEYD